MPKLVICLYLLLSSSAIQTSELDMDGIREGYFYASFGKDKIEGFHEQLMQVQNRSALIIAYDAASRAILTRTTWNWFKKLDYLDQSEALFEEAVKSEPKNVEIRLLRFTVEDRIPFYLGYSGHMEIDKKTILEYIDTYQVADIEPKILKFTIKRLDESGKFTEKELELLKIKLSNLN